MAVPTSTFPYVGSPPWFSGTAASSLVPNVFPVAIDGRAYMIDQKSGRFARQYEQRVRDSQDISTAPGEAAINPGGLWRRGQDSWHWGAGQQYADTAESKDYMFHTSKGVDPWTKGQLSLLNATKVSLSSAATTTHMVVQDGRVYVSVDGDVKYTTDPYASSPTWTAVVDEAGGTAAPTGTVAAMATDGTKIYLAYPSDGVRQVIPSTDPAIISNTKFVTGSDPYYMLGFAKGFMFGAHDHKLKLISSSGTASDVSVPDDTGWRWVGVAAGQNAIYAAGYAGKKSVVYKITIQNDGTLDTAIASLELPTGEVATGINAYLGFVTIGTNKGVRFCATDNQSNLVAGQLIPTSGDVKAFTFDDKYCWFTWTNYDGVSGGLGRLDLSQFTATNTPAYATDLMYTSTAAVQSVRCFPNGSGTMLKVFTMSGVGVVAEDTGNLVASGEIVVGTWRWGIPDRKFVAKIDVRATPLVGSITPAMSIDDGAWVSTAAWSTANETEFSVDGSDDKAIEAAFRFTLTRATATTGPTMTRWMARAYVSPYRSQVFVIPILLHRKVTIRDREYFYDVEENQSFFDSLIESPRIIVLQIGAFTHTVIVDDIEWESSDAHGNTWSFDGTLVVTLRSVEN